MLYVALKKECENATHVAYRFGGKIEFTEYPEGLGPVTLRRNRYGLMIFNKDSYDFELDREKTDQDLLNAGGALYGAYSRIKQMAREGGVYLDRTCYAAG